MSYTTPRKLRITSPRLMNSLFVGNFKAAFSGRGIEFKDFREYSPGDDAKYIDWLTSSREGVVVMRRYMEEKQGNILTLIDISESLYFDGSVKQQLLENVLELLSAATLHSGESFGGYMVGKEAYMYVVPQKSGVPLHRMKRYREISPREIDVPMSLDILNKQRGKKSILFIISDTTQIDEKSFRIAAMKHDLIYIHISSHFENTLEGTGLKVLRGIAAKLAVDLDNETSKKHYQEERTKQLNNFSKKLKNMGIDSIFLDETDSLYAEFLKLMKRREQ